jgi:pimeloyl-ACP methyl ester carboxylesterase
MFMPLATWVRDGIALNPSNMDEEIVARFVRESIDDVPFQMIHELATSIREPSLSSPYAYEFHLDTISAPILLLSGSIDRIVPPASMVALARRLRSSDVRLREMGVKTGDRIDYGHVDLLVGRHAPEDVYPPILDFIAEFV